jgi:hypothetical protein
VVVNRDGDDLLGEFLPDNVILEGAHDFLGFGDPLKVAMPDFLEDVVTEGDAFVTDIDRLRGGLLRGPGDELLDFLLALAAKRAVQQPASA